MNPYIRPDEKHKLNPAIGNLLNALRELECDESGMHDQTDDRVLYIITSLLQTLYTHSPSSHNQALGVLENAKLHFHKQHILPQQEQARYDNDPDSFVELD